MYYNITLNYESVNRVPAVSEEIIHMLKALREPIPFIECPSHDKISFDCEKIPTDEEATKIGETYRNSFNELTIKQGKEIIKMSIRFVGITNIKEIKK